MSSEPPKFLIKPRTRYVRQGETATLKCLCKGQPPPKVKWEKDGHTIEPSQKYRLYTVNQFNCLDIVNANEADRGIFICVITNSLGAASEPVNVDVTAPAQTAAAGELAPSGGNAVAAGLCPGGGAQPVSPRFTKHLNREEEVVEGDTVVIEVKSVTWFSDSLERHVLPRFIKQLENCHVSEGDAVTLACRGEPTAGRLASAGAAGCDSALGGFFQPMDSCSGAVAGRSDCSDIAHPQIGRYGSTPSSVAHEDCDWKRLASEASAPPQFVKELANLILTEGESVTIRCVTSAADAEPPAGALPPRHSGSRSLVNGDERKDAVTGRRPSVEPARCDYGPPLFIIQLPSSLTLEEGADMDVSCHVNNPRGDSSGCLDQSIPSF